MRTVVLGRGDLELIVERNVPEFDCPKMSKGICLVLVMKREAYIQQLCTE